MKIKSDWKRIMSYKWLYAMLIPGVVYYALFKFGPMFGLIAAFKNYQPFLGFFDSEWVGFKYFIRFFTDKSFMKLLGNTLTLSLLNLIFFFPMPILVALLLNEVKCGWFKRTVQSVVYLPHFLSWVVLGGIFIDILAPGDGLINQVIKAFGGQPIFFLGDNKWFPFTLIVTETWKSFGYGTIVYLAAITGIDLSLYEAAQVDGANRWKQIWHITLPGMRMVIVLLMVLSLGNVLNAGFDQVFNLYSPPVYASGDIIDTFVYRIGMLEAQFGVATAVGLFKSVISLTLISVSYWFAIKFADYQLF